MPAITIPGGATAPELNAHLAVPPVGDGPWPGVVVLHESFGLNYDIRQQADRLAAAGYYQGLSSVRSRGMFDDTKRYVDNVLALSQRFGG